MVNYDVHQSYIIKFYIIHFECFLPINLINLKFFILFLDYAIQHSIIQENNFDFDRDCKPPEMNFNFNTNCKTKIQENSTYSNYIFMDNN